jgi:hypothetical protein
MADDFVLCKVRDINASGCAHTGKLYSNKFFVCYVVTFLCMLGNVPTLLGDLNNAVIGKRRLILARILI